MSAAPKTVCWACHYAGYACTKHPAEPAPDAAALRAALDEAEARAEHWENVAISRDAKLQKAEAERDALQDHVTELLADQACGCGYDHPTDVCLGHLPLHRKIVAERDAANALLLCIADLTKQHGGAAQALKLIRIFLGAKT